MKGRLIGVFKTYLFIAFFPHKSEQGRSSNDTIFPFKIVQLFKKKQN